MFRGRIKAKSRVVVSFTAGNANKGTAAMVTSYGPVTGSARSKAVVIAPAGTASTTSNLKGKGLFRVIVDVMEDTDKGHLEVVVDGEPRDDGNIKGDMTWLYTVE